MTRNCNRLALAAACLALAVLVGCTEPKHVGGKKKNAVAHAPAAAVEKQEPEFIVGKRTKEIVPVGSEAAQGANVVAKPTITAKDPITLQGNAYVTMIGKTSILQIQHAVDLYHATNDRYPANYDEFMAEIIQANNIALPQLPAYQKYGYDEPSHSLVILEYPH